MTLTAEQKAPARTESAAPGETARSGETEKPAATKPELTPMQATLILAQRGNPAILDQLREVLDKNPHIAEHYGNLAGAIERSWIGLISGNDLLIKESVTRQLERLRQELTPATKLEGLLVERIASAWLQVQHSEMALSLSENEGLKIRQFRLKQAESSAHRFHASCKSLALVRRLMGGVELHVTHEHTINPPSPTGDSATAASTTTETSPLNIPAERRSALFGGVHDPVLENTHV